MSKKMYARLGHKNYRKLRDMVRGLTNILAFEVVCEGCVLDKHYRCPLVQTKHIEPIIHYNSFIVIYVN